MAKFYSPERNLSIAAKLLSRQATIVDSTAAFELSEPDTDPEYAARICAIRDMLKPINLFVSDATVLDSVAELLNPYTEGDNFDNEVWILRSLQEDYAFWAASQSKSHTGSNLG